VLHDAPTDLTPLLDAHAGLAQAYAGQGRDAPAKAEFQAAVAVIAQHQSLFPDEENKLTWFASVIRFYHEYVQFLMERGKPLEALEVTQLSRGRVLSARLGETNSRVQCTADDLLRKAAHSESTLLVYWIGPQTSYSWAIARTGIHYYELPGRTELERLVRNYDDFVQQLHDPLQESNPAGLALYEKLIAPAHVTTAKVMLQPDGPLHSLNFATLPVTGAPVAHYWIEDAQISVVPSFELTSPARASGARSLLLMGNPVMADAEFPELAFAGQEMRSIQASLPGVRQVVYERSDARPIAYAQSKPAQFSWIHFVAHATANQEEPLQSAVILSRDAGAEYRLFARNVVEIPLKADLVTISACRGAGAKIYAGEGLVGFSWAFLKSGARNVIAGLWDVNDRSTAEMMATLYAELGRGASPADALRTAQLKLVRSTGVFRKPYYWGPFEIFRSGPQ
jgi:CHAT domain-containing protein